MPIDHSIFISYRRSDSERETGRIDDHLSAHFGREAVFRDVDSLPLGVDFRAHLNRKVDRCEVLIAVIGDRWLDELNKRFLNDEIDWVRAEIAWALERQTTERKTTVIPVFVGSANSLLQRIKESLMSLLKDVAIASPCNTLPQQLIG